MLRSGNIKLSRRCVHIDVRKVFITSEVAKKFDLTPTYIIRIAKELNLSETEIREAGKRNYLFSEEAVEKIAKKLNKK